jgi:hypothetical protein
MSHPRLGTFVTDDLIQELNKLFPDRCARKGMTIEEIWIEAGSRKVIECLIVAKASLEENILNP